MSDMTFNEYLSKKDKVLSKFKKEFLSKYYNYDPMFNAILEVLARHDDPYEIIEELIIDRDRLVKQIEEVAMSGRSRFFIPKSVTEQIKKSIAVISLDIQDFKNWILNKNIKGNVDRGFKRFNSGNITYFCISKYTDLCSLSFDEAKETELAFKNTEYERIKSGIKQNLYESIEK